MPSAYGRHPAIDNTLKTKLTNKMNGPQIKIRAAGTDWDVEQYDAGEGDIYLVVNDNKSGSLLAYIEIAAPVSGDDANRPPFWNVRDTRTAKCIQGHRVTAQILTAWVNATGYELCSDRSQSEAGAGPWKQMIMQGVKAFELYEFENPITVPIQVIQGVITPDPWAEQYGNYRIKVS